MWFVCDKIVLIVISVLIVGAQCNRLKRQESNRRITATVHVFRRGFTISVPNDHHDYSSVQFKGNISGVSLTKRNAFAQTQTLPVDGSWTYIDNQSQLRYGDRINFEVLVTSSRTHESSVIDQQAFRVVGECDDYTICSFFENHSNCFFKEIMEDPFIDQSFTSPETPVKKPTRPTKESKPTNQYSSPPNTSKPAPTSRPSAALAPHRPQPDPTLSYNIKEIFQNPFKAPLTAGSDTAASTISNEYISNQLKIIMLDTQMAHEKINTLLHKIEGLEVVVNGLLTNQPDVSKQLLIKGAPHQLSDLAMLYEMRSFVEHKLELPWLTDNILSATRTRDGVLLNMRSVMDKLTILFRSHTALDIAPLEIVDTDQPSTGIIRRRQAVDTESSDEGRIRFDVRYNAE